MPACARRSGRRSMEKRVRLPVRVAALRADRAAAVVITSSSSSGPRPGAVPVAAGPGRVRRSAQFVWFENFETLFNDPSYLDVVQGHRGLLGAGRGARPVDLAGPRGVRRSRAARRGGLQDAADLALRGGAGRGRRAVAVPVQSDARHRRALRCGGWASTGTRCSTATTR